MTAAKDTKDGRTSILSSLTAEVMGEKTKAAKATLTPVAGESTFPLEKALIPNDTGTFMSNEGLHTHAKNLRAFAAEAITIADGLDAILNEPSTEEAKTPAKVDPRFAGSDPVETPAVIIEATKADIEDATDDDEPADFGAAFAAKQAAAQAATFKAPGWVCLVHHKPGIEKKSAKGRDFIGCPDCNQFFGG